MRRPRLTIARWMGLTAIFAVNAALVRAFVVREMFHGGILIFVALQVGLWYLPRSRGRLRRFWLGFEASGIATVLFLLSCEFFPGSPLNRPVMAYTGIVGNLAFAHLPARLADHLDEHWDLFLAVVYFLPELAAALLGGMIAAFPVPTGLPPARATLREESLRTHIPPKTNHRARQHRPTP
jgi:hypothetical protein